MPPSILAGMLGLVYVNYFYKVYILDQFAAFPEPVAQQLRKAIYFTNMDLQPPRALKYYQQALQLAAQMGMDPFSDAILGVRIEIAFLFEKANARPAAIRVLEDMREKMSDWLEKRDEEGNVIGEPVEAKPGEEGGEEDAEKVLENVRYRRLRRTEVLKKTVRIAGRLGDFYSEGVALDPELAEERMVWAVTALLREQKRRDDVGVKDGEGEWFGHEEVRAALESLGTHYASQRKNYLAAPLFLQALGVGGNKDCHAVVTMNNLAAALALQNPGMISGQPAASATQQLDDASTWAKKALQLAQEIRPPQRTEECDEGCAVATVNLGDFAALGGNTLQARAYYIEGKSLSKGIGFQEGVARADKALMDMSKQR
ncbi:uncharacterized protein KY384_006193 [Bacidia gigantensis]|uniref:uncharacterized protein n=1 Tax=Bacidia gigantensis TaxID=2732470 RepID=UPI001D03AE92|nr:uncharacterized protein KY384_006193 [Bacidia gigantensis]KAG8529556.1 hypothetical protein KY384_006193 [Bacidia gigantensis]